MTEQLTTEQLTTELHAIRSRCYELYKTITKLKTLEESYHKIYMHWRKRYKELDEFLAETDGRLTVLPPRLGNRRLQKPPKVKDLTREQIETLAKKLGVDINFKGEANVQ